MERPRTLNEAVDQLEKHAAELAELKAVVSHLQELTGAGYLLELPLAPAERPAEPEWTTLARAAAFLGVSLPTMRAHVARYGLGHKIGGGWHVSVARLEALKAGKLGK